MADSWRAQSLIRRLISKPSTSLLCMAMLSSAAVASTDAMTGVERLWQDPTDPLIQRFTEQVHSGDTQCVATLDTLIETRDDFRLAQLLKAEMLAAQAGQAPLLARHDAPAELAAALEGLLDEWNVRAAATPAVDLPASAWQMSERSEFLVAVDMQRHRQSLYQRIDDTWTLRSDHYVSIGRAGYGKQKEGDLLTPVGPYYTTGFHSDRNLPDLYGAGAFPLNYPNAYDHFLGRTGYGIWLHGVPRAHYSRIPKASEGCVTMSNEAFDALAEVLPRRNVPVLLLPEQGAADSRAQRHALLDALAQWEQDWESRDPEAYLRHYSADFQPKGESRQAWVQRKSALAASRQFIEVDVLDPELLAYPDGSIVSVRFVQNYRADTFKSEGETKQMFWRWEDDAWRILVETTA